MAMIRPQCKSQSPAETTSCRPGKGGRIDELPHVNFADRDAGRVRKGWKTYYCGALAAAFEGMI